jgi:hypothetical protein
MEFATSMYRGGEPVAALDCNYDSYAELGLQCPFCKEAVFLKREHKRSIEGRPVIVGAHFAHYHTGVVETGCVWRSKSLSLSDRQTMMTGAKNQRLELYNAVLWDLIRDDRHISTSILKKVRNDLGERFFLDAAKNFRGQIGDRESLVRQFITDINSGDARPAASLSHLPEASRQVDEQEEYFRRCSIDFHVKICMEVLDFLSTRTGGYALQKVLLIAAWISLTQLRKKPSPEDFELLSVTTIAGCHWETILINALHIKSIPVKS